MNSPSQNQILLAEDYPANVLVAGTYLEIMGFGFDVAVNGSEAVQKATECKYHIILMDVEMPIFNGYEATKIIRKYEADNLLNPTVIIGMTAHALVGHHQKCLDAGMNDYISKPFVLADLKTKLAYWTEKSVAEKVA